MAIIAPWSLLPSYHPEDSNSQETEFGPTNEAMPSPNCLTAHLDEKSALSFKFPAAILACDEKVVGVSVLDEPRV
jgi:hypothetical protein